MASICCRLDVHEQVKSNHQSHRSSIQYSKSDLDDFRFFVEEHSDKQFLEIFFTFRKNSGSDNSEEINQDYLHKVLFLEHFIARSMFLEEITCISEQGVTGYLLTENRLNSDQRAAIKALILGCVSQATLMLRSKLLKNYINGRRLMLDGTIAKKLEDLRKMVSKITSLRETFFTFQIQCKATKRILDYRYAFFNTVASACYCYLVLLSTYSLEMENYQIHLLLAYLEEMDRSVGFVNTNISQLLSDEATDKVFVFEIDADLKASLESIYYCEIRKASAEEQEQAINKILDVSLRVVSQYRIIQDITHCLRLQKDLLDRVRNLKQNTSIVTEKKKEFQIVVPSPRKVRESQKKGRFKSESAQIEYTEEELSLILESLTSARSNPNSLSTIFETDSGLETQKSSKKGQSLSFQLELLHLLTPKPTKHN